MKKLVLLFLLVAIFNSCSYTYYQVFSIKPENSEQTQNGSPIYKKDGLEFIYNFWGEYGNLRFIIYNSNDYDVIVDMTKSAFIRNNIAEDYYQNKQFETRIATAAYNSAKYGVSINKHRDYNASTLVNYFGKTYDVALSIGAATSAHYISGTTTKREWQSAVITSEPKSIRIPAKSAKAFCSFDINETRIISNQLGANDTYTPIVFNKTTSPMDFRNRICITKDNGEVNYYDMNFYIQEIGNVKQLSGMEKPTNFFISYSSSLEQNRTNDEILEPTQVEGDKREEEKEDEVIKYRKNIKENNRQRTDTYTKEKAINELKIIQESLKEGTSDLQHIEIVISNIEDWYYNKQTFFIIDLEKELKATKTLLRESNKNTDNK